MESTCQGEKNHWNAFIIYYFILILPNHVLPFFAKSFRCICIWFYPPLTKFQMHPNVCISSRHWLSLLPFPFFFLMTVSCLLSLNRSKKVFISFLWILLAGSFIPELSASDFLQAINSFLDEDCSVRLFVGLSVGQFVGLLATPSLYLPPSRHLPSLYPFQ